MSEANKVSRLGSLGYDRFFEDSRLNLDVNIDQIARVSAEHRGAYEIINLDGEFRATVSGKFMLNASRRNDYPAVGDWVIVKDSLEDAKVIESILPRRTFLRKKYSGKDEAQLIASNVDVAFIVESMNRDYNVNRFERYIVLALEGGVRPVVILNKSDLIADTELSARIEQLRQRFHDVDILRTSVLTDDGLSELSNYIKNGSTYCFLGSSGVGKSSIINKLINKDSIETKEIGSKTGRGRHTTTAREMYFTSEGGIIIDNPGSREVGIIDFGSGSKELFIDIEKLAGECKFKDCRHINEKGCAVLAAIDSGYIDASQYENYLKLRSETEHYEMSSQERRQKDKKFGKYIKTAKVDLKKYRSK
ncbi:ribosome small subunit-dependent GTPase A [Candidatus Saccharibacteria bacterium]|nr:ribosome small subunit-dependent GTPase A [Candidatus Saccharibacteria bacterium]